MSHPFDHDAPFSAYIHGDPPATKEERDVTEQELRRFQPTSRFFESGSLSIASSRRPSTAASSVFSTTSSAPPIVFRGGRLLLLGIGIVLALVLITLGLFCYIFVTHEWVKRGAEIITAAPLGGILALVHSLAVILVVSLPFVVSLVAYSLASAWLAASVDSGHNRPTPFQLGLIMQIVYGAHLPAMWAVLKYMFFGSRRASFKPRILRRAFAIFATALTIVYSYLALDVALSASSHAMSFAQLQAVNQSSWLYLSKQVNASQCATTAGQVYAGVNLCGLEDASSTPFAASLLEGIRTLTNTSTDNAVALANDGTAIVVSTTLPQDIAFSATSYGVRATCQSITADCIGSGPWTSDALTFSCPSFNAVNSSSGTYPFGVLDASGSVYTQPYLVDTNPFSFGAVVTSQAYSASADSFAGNTGFFVHGSAGATNVLTCSVTVLSVNYTYYNGSFIVDPTNTTATANLDIVRTVAAMSGAGVLASRVPSQIDGATDYASAFGYELARELAGLSVMLYAPAEVQEMQRVTPVIGSRLSLPLLVLLLVCIASHILLTLYLAFSAVYAASSSPYTLLATARLSSPLTAVYAGYARGEAHRTWERAPQKLFSVETGLDRLSVGPVVGAGGGLAFGVSRAVGMHGPVGPRVDSDSKDTFEGEA